MASFTIPAETLGKQHKASDPKQSVWVSANAGSGKTHVLASRVIRLLLQGVAPSKILCLTFTKAAAANMASGVFDKLARWTRLADDELAQEIIAVGAAKPARQDLTAARKLFARTLETPGGLKIQTIHAFCERLLHLFPFEANVPARFEVADDQGQAELLERARRAVLTKAKSGTDTLGAALERLNEDCGPDAFEDLIKEAMRQSVLSRVRSPDAVVENLRRALGLTKGRDVASIEREMAEDGIAPERWSELAALLGQGTANDQKQAELFRQALAAYRSAASSGCLRDCLNSYLAIYFTGKGEARKSLLTKGLAGAHPEIEAELQGEQLRLAALDEERKAAATIERTRALIEIASLIFKRYSEEKAARGILDFDDLIGKTLSMIERSDARWVLYKLDAGIDHVLVDEAQDTSEAQWKILEELTGDFAAGRGQSAAPRTFFAVGDEKQSIFSFQGAAPKMFDEMRRKFDKRFTDGGHSFAHVPLNASFRSAPGVLAAIDRLFEHGDHKSGVVAASDVWLPHQAVKHHLPGLVELWPLAVPPANENPRDWKLPFDLLDQQDPANIVAKRVAQKIAQLIDLNSGAFVHDGANRRLARPGDILILVRTRGPFFEAIIRALKTLDIPTAGADRLELTQHIAVMDLMAAGQASLLPQDDLTLACVLKSPLIGFDDDDLLALAPGRGGSLFDALQASTEPKHAAAARKLALWRARVAEGPFAFYASLLGPDGGRRALEGKIGREAGDALDEFLNLAMAHEAGEAPSLAAFLHDLAGIEYSIKRDMETGENVVRVMTIHAAKGLEAKIMFLPDTCGVPAPRHDPKIFTLTTHVPGEETIAWSPRKDLDCAAVAAAREAKRRAAMEEYKRLLYVALTRAEERLYIAGFQGVREPDPGSWDRMIKSALGQDAGMEAAPAFWNGEEEVLRFVSNGSGAPAAGECAEAGPEAGAGSPKFLSPAWLQSPAPPEEAAKPLTPSRAIEETAGESPGLAQKRRAAAQRGRLIHLLLQHLPDVAAPNRRPAALAFLAARAAGLDEISRQNLADEALAVIDLPELAGLYGPGSRAEFAVAGRRLLGQRTIEVAGRVDRIGEAAGEILLADYKTGIPCALAATPAAHLTQLALYHAVLAPLWPNKTLRMLLIWTQGPLVVPIPAENLDAALVSVAADGAPQFEAAPP